MIVLALLIVPSVLGVTTFNYIQHYARNTTENVSEIIITDDYGNVNRLNTNSTESIVDKIFTLIVNETIQQSVCGSVTTNCKPEFFVQPQVIPPCPEINCQPCQSCQVCAPEDKSAENNCIDELGRANEAILKAGKKDYTWMILVVLVVGGAYVYLQLKKPTIIKEDDDFHDFVKPPPQPIPEKVIELPKQPEIDLEREMREAKKENEEAKKKQEEIQKHLDTVGANRGYVGEGMEEITKELQEYERKHRLEMAKQAEAEKVR